MTEGVLGRAALKRMSPGAFEVPRIASSSMSRRYRAACRRAGLYAWLVQAGRRLHALWLFMVELSWPVRNAAGSAIYTVCGQAVRLRGLVAGRNARASQRETEQAKARSRRKNQARITTALAFSAVGLLFCTLSMYRVGLEVSLNGVPVGFVASQSEFEQSVEAVAARAGEILGVNYTLHPDVSYRLTVVNKKLIYDSNEVERAIFAEIPNISELYLLKVDGVTVGGMTSAEQINAVLDKVKAQYVIPDRQGKADFVQSIEITRQMTAKSNLRTADELYGALTAPTRAELTHTLSDEESAGRVAEQYGMGVVALAELNPTLDMSMVAPGQTLLVQARKTVLSVAHVYQYSYPEPIPYETEYVDDPKLWAGETKVVTEGVDGEMLLFADEHRLDGYIPEKTITGSLVLTEPVTEVIANGTRTRNPTGTYIRPHGGQVTSNYGARYVFGRYDFHDGIDFAGRIGEPVVASDGGTVIFAGQKTGYGLVVIMSHGNGITTYYAHCSKLLVKEGQKIGQGEQIAKLGNTGRSTGPHVHFEVRVNNVQQNPNKYLNLK